MLEIIDRLAVFFEDCYREVSVREYARNIGVSPPTASKLLNGFVSEGILLRREDRGFLLFRIDSESRVALGLSRIYWEGRLKNLVIFLRDELRFDSVVLFGSLGKLEATKSSDVDLVVFCRSKKALVGHDSGEPDVDLKKFERKLGREVQIFRFENLENVSEELRLNIVNGCVLGGYLE